MRFLFLITISFMTLNSVTAEGIDFFHGKWDEALAQAREEGKVIFVDAYATWCGPCKRMSKYVFTDKSVGAFYNDNFINVKMDMEGGQGIEFRKEYPVSAFPTLYFIAPDGEVVFATKGARGTEEFIKLGKRALNKYNPVAKYREKYEEGNREYELVYNYVKAMNRSGESSLKVANEYLDTQEDLTTENNLRFILEATTEADSRIFDLLIEHRDEIEKITSEQAVQSRIKKACAQTVDKAIEFEAPSLIDAAVEKMVEHYRVEAEFFEYNVRLKYAEEVGTTEEYLDRLKDFVKEYDGDRPNEVINMGEHVLKKYSDSPEALEIVADGAKKAARKTENAGFHFVHAKILQKLGETDDALDALDQAIEIAGNKEDEASLKDYQNFKKMLKKRS